MRSNFTSDGHNFVGIVGFSNGLTNGANGDQVGTSGAPINPLLDVLKNNGGATDTHALGSGSNAGDNSLAPPTDQRGYLRSGLSDIGAFEFNGTVPVLKILSIAHASNGHILLQGRGIISSLYAIEASADPNPDRFISIGTTMSDGTGAWQYDDGGSVGLPRCFYRLTFP